MEFKELQKKSQEITKSTVNYIEDMIVPAIKYEEIFNFRRQLGITGEIGKIYVCYFQKLRLMIKSNTSGFNAIDNSGNKVQIKTIRKDPTRDYSVEEIHGKLGRFSKHKFDYCIMLILDKYYKPEEMWKASSEDLKELLSKNELRSPTIIEFKKVALKLEIPKQIQ